MHAFFFDIFAYLIQNFVAFLTKRWFNKHVCMLYL